MKNFEISKTLLIKLLNETREDDLIVLDVEDDLQESNKFEYLLSNDNWYSIDIVNLANNCKKFLMKEYYIFMKSYIISNGEGVSEVFNKNEIKLRDFISTNEQSAILKAYIWLNEEKLLEKEIS